jgi:hypothetical protein
VTRLLCFVTALIAASCSRDFDGATDAPSTGEAGSGGEGGAANGPPLALTNELIDQSMEAMCMQAAMVSCPEAGAAGQAGEGGAPSVPVPPTASSSFGERERAVRDQCLYFWSLVATGRTRNAARCSWSTSTA